MWERPESRGTSIQKPSEWVCVLPVRSSETGGIEVMGIIAELWPDVERERLIRYFGVDCE
jgi:hypothetical protein